MRAKMNTIYYTEPLMSRRAIYSCGRQTHDHCGSDDESQGTTPAYEEGFIDLRCTGS